MDKKKETGEVPEEEKPSIKKMVTYKTSSSSFEFTGLDVVILGFAVGFGLTFGAVAGYHSANYLCGPEPLHPAFLVDNHPY